MTKCIFGMCQNMKTWSSSRLLGHRSVAVVPTRNTCVGSNRTLSLCTAAKLHTTKIAIKHFIAEITDCQCKRWRARHTSGKQRMGSGYESVTIYSRLRWTLLCRFETYRNERIIPLLWLGNFLECLESHLLLRSMAVCHLDLHFLNSFSIRIPCLQIRYFYLLQLQALRQTPIKSVPERLWW